MSVETIFIGASLIFGLAVIVAANIWAVREPAETEVQRSLSRAIEDILDAESAGWEGRRSSPPRRSENLDGRSDESENAFGRPWRDQTQSLAED
jgi:hypothetical protein